MILEVWQTLVIVGLAASGAAFVAKKAPVYTGLASLGVWLVVGYGALEIELVVGGSLETVAEPAVAALAFGNALLSVIVIVAAATGSYGADDEGVPNPTVSGR